MDAGLRTIDTRSVPAIPGAGKRRPPARDLLAMVLLAPASSLVTGWLLAAFAGALPRGATIGVHSYVPLATVLPVGTLAQVAAVLALLAVPLVPWRELLSPGATTRALTRLVGLGLAAQAALFLLQVVAVEELQGLADPGSVIALAIAAQVLLHLLLAAAAALTLGTLAWRCTPVPRRRFAPGLTPRGARSAAVDLRAGLRRLPRRRGPPAVFATA
ncbi:MAG: hypothetical protein QOE92_531 [Chloroflexota bacterium]|jgi:hypothetical protein|nr:hypothetical protein [Chloroflexota bacterium]